MPRRAPIHRWRRNYKARCDNGNRRRPPIGVCPFTTERSSNIKACPTRNRRFGRSIRRGFHSQVGGRCPHCARRQNGNRQSELFQERPPAACPLIDPKLKPLYHAGMSHLSHSQNHFVRVAVWPRVAAGTDVGCQREPTRLAQGQDLRPAMPSGTYEAPGHRWIRSTARFAIFLNLRKPSAALWYHHPLVSRRNLSSSFVR